MNSEQAILDFLKSLSTVDFGMVMQVVGLLFLGFWFIVVWWVWVDSGERSKSKFFRIISVIITMLPVLGLIIYFIVRPKSTLEEIYWADLERRFLKYETMDLGDCPSCGYQLQPGFIICPNCSEKLKNKCACCENYIDKKWKTCPYCGCVVEAPVVMTSTEVNTEAIQDAADAAKDEIVATVEEGRTKYARRRGLVAMIGNFFGGIGRFFKRIFTRKKKIVVVKPEEGEVTSETAENVEQSGEVSMEASTQQNDHQGKKKKKNKKHRK